VFGRSVGLQRHATGRFAFDADLGGDAARGGDKGFSLDEGAKVDKIASLLSAGEIAPDASLAVDLERAGRGVGPCGVSHDVLFALPLAARKPALQERAGLRKSRRRDLGEVELAERLRMPRVRAVRYHPSPPSLASSR
jgi:hypothetical protein